MISDLRMRMQMYDIDFPNMPLVHVTPSNMQKVANTGSWHRVLSDADHGHHTHGITEGHNTAVDLGYVTVYSMAYLAGGSEYSSDLLFAGVSKPFAPLTCEVAGQTDWDPKQQKAKQQAKVKKAKAN